MIGSAYEAFWNINDELESRGIEVGEDIATVIAVIAEEIEELVELYHGAMEVAQDFQDILGPDEDSPAD